jgi:quercetin dioxygenase-like cupin family protein
MSGPCIQCGDVVDLEGHSPHALTEKTVILVQSDDLTVTRLDLAANAELPPQRTVGDATLQCLFGRVEITLDGEIHKLAAHQLIYLPAKTPHSMKAVSASTLLLTSVIPTEKPRKAGDEVDEASKESFPASDPPAHS